MVDLKLFRSSENLRSSKFLKSGFVVALWCRVMPEKARAEQLHLFLARMNVTLICTSHSDSLVCGV